MSYFVPIIVFILIQQVASERSLLCTSIQSPKKHCQFPFVYDGVKYEECTKTGDPNGKFWCSTKTSENSDHVPGNWGHCTQECIQYRAKEKSILNLIPEHRVLRNGQANCENCKFWKECPWAKKLVGFLNTFPRGHSVAKRFSRIIKQRTCPDEKFYICCGEENRFVPPSPKPSLPGKNSIYLMNSHDSTLGTWKPQSTSEKQECGVTSLAGHVYGGQRASPGDFPFIVILGYDTKGSILSKASKLYLCGGSLINKYYVLTAAHCHSNTQPITEIVLGEFDLSTDPDCTQFSCRPPRQIRQPAYVILHDKWKPDQYSLGYDIALVRLDRPALLVHEDPFNSRVSPVCLPWRSEDPGHKIGSGTQTIVTGWGRTANTSVETYYKYQAGTAVLQKLNLTVISTPDCQKEFNFFSLNEETQLCAGGTRGQDSCGGDSGGPLIYTADSSSNTPMYLVGIVSFGSVFCEGGIPGVYTKVLPYLKWIDQNMEP